MIIYYVLNKSTQICFQINYKASPCPGCQRIKSCIIQQDKKVLILAVNANLILTYYGCKYQNVASKGKKKVFLPSVIGALRGQDHVCLCMFTAPVSRYMRNKKSNVN